MSELQPWVKTLVQERYGTMDKLARRIGITLSAFARGVKGSGTLAVETLLRLAEETGESPSVVLRRANKGEVADLIERLYGSGRPPAIGRADVRAVAALLEGCSAEYVASVRQMAEEILHERQRGSLRAQLSAMPAADADTTETRGSPRRKR